jgi:hypothetical protein
MTLAIADSSATAPVPVARRAVLTAVPNCEPPYDEPQRPNRRTFRRGHRAWPLPAGAPLHDWTVPGWSRESDVGVTHTSASALPAVRGTAAMLARALVEALAGFRQIRQLASVCSPEVYSALMGRVEILPVAPRIKSIRTCEPADGVVEASAVFLRGNRAAALAFRLQGIDGRWRVTAVQLG